MAAAETFCFEGAHELSDKNNPDLGAIHAAAAVGEQLTSRGTRRAALCARGCSLEVEQVRGAGGLAPHLETGDQSY
ncbi:hypothetical protein NDU88_002009 [Pleurodeles waltl]|uniref:Uncharacterized protein n=1 Tax=Pleurodeles waltl TaxID=8319 RepID=A0AAV7TJI5_PLEWA|nr:hypothetical protein NDU88_002009 [Pleurodeles waltl]